MDIAKVKRDLCEEFIEVSKLTYEENLENANEVFAKWDIPEYNSQIFTDCNDDTLDNMKITIEFIKKGDSQKIQLWKYLRNITSSIPEQKQIGRGLMFFIKDSVTNKILGISRIGSDIFQCKARDDYIGWEYEHLRIKLPHVVNIWCCVGMQPVAFNYNVGKLIASLCFSREVLDEWERIYKDKIAAITTFSINGKSIQYDRLPNLKFVGYTKGKGTLHIPNDLYERSLDMLKLDGVDINEVCPRQTKISRVGYILYYLGLTQKILSHGKERGVYIGTTSKEDSIPFLNNKVATFKYECKSIDEIAKWWKERWALPRYLHLKTTNRLKSKDGEDDKENEIFEERPSLTLTVDDAKNIGILTASYLAGFIDGDGSISLRVNYNSIYISSSQCVPYPIFSLLKQFGSKIRFIKAKNNNSRNQYTWEIVGERSLDILNFIKDKIIIKQKRCLASIEFIEKYKESDTLLPELSNNIISLQKDYEPITKEVYMQRMNIEYIAGIFDAEGCILARIRNNRISVGLVITQKSNSYLMEIIKTYLGYGTVRGFRYCIDNHKNIYTFLKNIVNLISVKKKQSEIFINYYENKDDHNYSIKDLKNICYSIKKEKHTNYIVTTADLRAINEYYKRDFPVIKKKIRVVPKKREYKNISNQAISQRVIGIYKQSKITDEIIDNIRKDLENKLTKIAISKKYDIDRNIVTQIAKGIRVKSTEVTEKLIEDKHKMKESVKNSAIELSTEDKKKYAHERSAITKRGTTPSQIIEILQYVKANPYKTAEDIVAIFTYINEAKLQNIILGKTMAYEREFENGDDYNNYIELQKEVKELQIKSNPIKRAIKIRSLDAHMIISVVKTKQEYPNKTHNEIAKIYNISETQVRAVLRCTMKCYEHEFPILNMSYHEYLEVLGIRE